MQQMKSAIGSAMRWSVVTAVVAIGVWLLLEMLLQPPIPEDAAANVAFESWYGNWRAVLIATAVFAAFLLGFAPPRRRVAWRNAGLYLAFLISLFTEMFGIPLTISLLAPMLDLPTWFFGMNESHLWAFALHYFGVMPLYAAVHMVMVASAALIVAGVNLLAVGWATVHRGRGALVTSGIYRYLRHPQYLGLILIVIGFNVQWPTLPTLVMGPVLVVMYIWLARREDAELAMHFGEEYRSYAARTPAFVPWARGRRISLEEEQQHAEKSTTAVPGRTPREHLTPR